MSPTDAETCSRCGRLLLCSEQACVFGGMIVCAECDRVLRSRQAPQPKAPSPKPAVSAETVAVPFSPAPAQAQPIGSRRTRPVWVVGAIGGGIATICAVVVLVILLKSHGGGGGGTGVIGVFGSPYSADYKIVSEGYRSHVKVTVRGPSAKLAVILTDPDGESRIEIIPQEAMISNCQTVEVPMNDPRAGTWVLAVKTFDPEKVVWQKELTFSLDQLMVEDVKFHFEPGRRFTGELTGDFALVWLEIALRKDGNLPVDFTDVSIAVGDANRGFCSFEGDHIMIDQKQTVRVKVSLFATEKMKEEESKRGWRGLPAIYALFWPGDRYLVKGTLFYGKDHKSLDFEKEFVVPAEDKPQSIKEAQHPEVTFSDMVEKDRKELLAEPNTKDLTSRSAQSQAPTVPEPNKSAQPSEPQPPKAGPVTFYFTLLDETEQIEAEQLLAMIPTGRSIGRLPMTGYSLMVETCRQIMGRWPDSIYDYKARRALNQMPERFRERHKITGRELDLTQFTKLRPNTTPYNIKEED